MSHKAFINVSLDSEADADILRWVESQPKGKRSEAVRDAIRNHLGHTQVTLGDVLQAVRNLERKIKAGAGAGGDLPAEGGDPDEPPDVAAALDALAEL